MASKTINIDADLYLELKEVKKNLSFSEYICILQDNFKPSPRDFFGTLGDDDLSYDEIKKMRKTRDVTL